jgi:hypothetical protein
MLQHVDLVRTDVSGECIASIITVTRIGELGKLAATTNQSTLMMEVILSSKMSLLTTQKMAFFVVTILKT